ncbi:MAG: ankyrin repeat domain-containing protein [Gammaproteobacteria bacterium]|nr:ankyrin repeat domain-containing protein [Gammaproteobacteria bacterium]
MKRGEGTRLATASRRTAEDSLIITDLDVDILQHITSSDTVALSLLARTCGIFRRNIANLLLERRKQEYQEISLLLGRYGIPMPLDDPNRFQSNLIKSAGLVEAQIINMNNSDIKLLYQHYSIEYLFYKQLPVKDIKPDSVDIALQCFTNDLASQIATADEQSMLNLTVGTLNLAASSGIFALVQWLCHPDRGIAPNKVTLRNAAFSGDFALVQWLCHEDRRDYKQTPAQDILDCAAYSGDVELVEWLCHSYIGIELSKGVLMNAARSGSLALVKWMCDEKRGEGQQTPDQATLGRAAESGSIEVVAWLCHEDRGSNRLTANQITLSDAVSSGCLALVTWLCHADRGDARLTPDSWSLGHAEMVGDRVLIAWLQQHIAEEKQVEGTSSMQV